jgi:hypothetical protein
MRLDQYLGIEETARTMWKVQRHYYYSILPTDTRYARSALLGGAFPCDIAGDDEEMPAAGDNDEARLLERRLAAAKIKLSGGAFHIRMTEADGFMSEISSHENSRLAVIVADFVDLLTRSGSPGAIAQEIAPG